MSEDDKTRSTSFAKTVNDLVQHDSALDRIAALSEEFRRAVQPPQPAVEQTKARESDERTLTHAPAPAMNLRPGGLARYIVDKQIDKQKLSALDARALELYNAAKQRFEKPKSKDLSQQFEQHKHRLR